MPVQFHPTTHRLTITIDSPIFESAHAARLTSDLLPYSAEAVEAVEVDLSQVERIDSAAVHTLAGLRQGLANHQAPVALSHPRPEVRKVLNLLGMDRLFQIDAASIN